MSKYNIEIEFNNKVAISSVQALTQQLNILDAKIKSISKNTNFSKSFYNNLSGVKKSAEQAASGIDKLNRSVEKTPGYFKNLQRWAATALSVFSAKKLIDAADAYTEVGNKIRALSGDTADYVTVQNELFDIAQRSRVDISATAQLYTRLTQAQQNLGASTEDLLKFTEGVGKALQISGASAFTQRGVLLQLSQAMGTDVVRAEEFNSILEGGIRIAKAAAEGMDGLGGSVAALRKRVVDGKVSSKEFFDAIMSQLPKLEAEFARTTPTISQAFTIFNNGLTQFIGGVNDAYGVSSIIAKVIIDLGSNIGALVASLGAAGIAFSTFSLKANLATQGLNLFSKAGLSAAALNPWIASLTALSAAYLVLREDLDSSNRELDSANSLYERNSVILGNLEEQTKQSLQTQISVTEKKIKTLEVEKQLLETGQKTVGVIDMLKASWDGVTVSVDAAWSKVKGFADVVTGGPIIRFIDKIFGESPNLGVNDLINDLETKAIDKKISDTSKAISELESQQEQLKSASKNAKDLTIKPTASEGPDKKTQKRLDKLANTIQKLKRQTEEFYMTADQKAVWDGLSAAGIKYDEVIVGLDGSVRAINPLFQEQVEIISQLSLKYKEISGPMGQLIQQGNELTSVWRENSVFSAEFYQSLLKTEQGQNLLVTAFSDLEDQIVNFAKEGEFSIQDFTESFLENILRLMTQMLIITPIAESMWAAINGNTTQGSGLLTSNSLRGTGGSGSLLSSAGSGILSSLLGGGSSFSSMGSYDSAFNAGMVEAGMSDGSWMSAIGDWFSSLFLANGGPIKGPGTSKSDSIPAFLSNGEYVVNARSASRFRPMLDAINNAPHFAKGGSVGGGQSGSFGGTDVQIIDMRGKDAPAVQTRKTTGSDGREQIKVLIKQTVSQGFADGSFDKSIRNNYGIRRSAYNRG